MKRYDAIVVGLGVMGSAAAYALTKRGLSVAGFDQYAIPNRQGSSHGDTRAIRRCYFEHPDYVPLLQRSYEGWRALQDDIGLQLLHENGCLHMGNPERDMIAACKDVADQHCIPYELIDHPTLRERYPQFRVPEDHIGLFEPGGGYVLAEATIHHTVKVAAKMGAHLKPHETVESWDVTDRGITIRTSNDTFGADRLVFCAGPWSARLLHDFGVPLTVSRQTLSWWNPSTPELFTPDRFPVFSIDDPDGLLYYGFPETSMRPGMKFARHYTGSSVDDPAQVGRDITDDDRTFLQSMMDQCIPAAAGSLAEIQVCMYTNTPDGHFVIDRHPAWDNVFFAAGFSGHGFKFAPVIGEALADLVVHDSTQLPIDFLRLHRFNSAGA